MLIHPITLIGVVIWISSLALFSTSVGRLLILCVISLFIIIFMLRNRIKEGFGKLRRIAPLIVVVIAMQILFRRSGDIVYSVMGYGIYKDGLVQGALVSLRFVIIICGAITLSRLSFTDFRTAFAMIRLPEEISFMVFYVFRFVNTLQSRYTSALSMLKLRGVTISKLGLIPRIYIYQSIALSVLANALYHSRIQAISLELRGFRSAGNRTMMHHQKPGYLDAVVLVVIALFTVVLLRVF